jgi:hypothetical protein
MPTEATSSKEEYLAPLPIERATGTEIQSAIDHYTIAENYFSDILQAQTAIFSVIVAAIVALYFLFNWRASRVHVSREITKQIGQIREEFEKNFNEKIESLQEIFFTAISQHDTAIGEMRGQTYRTLGQFWESEGENSTAFTWWMRSTQAFALIKDARHTRIALDGAKRSVEAVKYGYELDLGSIGEYQKLIADVDDAYKIEKEMLDAAVKAAIERKPPTT